MESQTLHGHGQRHVMIDFHVPLVRQRPTHEWAPSGGGRQTITGQGRGWPCHKYGLGRSACTFACDTLLAFCA